jgi:hypothetical protein
MEALDRILAVTEAVERLVDRGDWAGATALDEERRRMLVELIGDRAGDAVAENRDFLESLLARNDGMIRQLGARRRTTLAAAAQELSNGTDAARAYAANSPAGGHGPLRLVCGGEGS